MDNFKPYEKNGRWYRGNLHTHSTLSDGVLKPAEVVERYKEKGWDFIAMTDHFLYYNNEKLNDDNFLVIPGTEIGVDKPEPCRMYHIVGIENGGAGENKIPDGQVLPFVEWNGTESVQKSIDSLTSRDNLAILCHPDWSRMEYDDIRDLNGFFAMEVFNYGCELESHTGLCTSYWDSFLRRGKKVWGVATDDAHHVIDDRCGGWVMVKAAELTQKSITEALIEGSFYSSNGPSIDEFRIEDDEVIVQCSPVEAIHFVTYEDIGYSLFAAEGTTIESGSYKLSGTAKYVRVECVDSKGRTAWTNPIFLR